MKKLNKKILLLIIIVLVLVLMAIGIFVFSNGQEETNINNPKTEISIKPIDSFLEGKSVFEVITSPSDFHKLDTKKLFDETYFSYKQVRPLGLELNSKGYMIVDLDNRDVLFGEKYDEVMYPASLTKLITLDTILNICTDLNEKASFSNSEREALIAEDASLSYLDVDTLYTVKDLLYALVLPSGADAAKALENYCLSKNLNLIEEMNKQCLRLGCANTNITNTTGLHDDLHYTTLSDYLKVVYDVLSFQEGVRVLSCFEYECETGEIVKSTLRSLGEYETVDVKGGKTGYTGMAGQCLCAYYEYLDKPYLYFGYGANGKSGESLHFDDFKKVMEFLYD